MDQIKKIEKTESLIKHEDDYNDQIKYTNNSIKGANWIGGHLLNNSRNKGIK